MYHYSLLWYSYHPKINIEMIAKMWKVKYSHLIHWYIWHVILMHPYCQNWCIAARKKRETNDSFLYRIDVGNKILLKMLHIFQRNCIMNDVDTHFPQLCLFHFACYRWCAYFSGCDELLHHIWKLFFLVAHTPNSSKREITLRTEMSAIRNEGGNAFRNFLTDFFSTYKPSDCQNTRTLIEFIIFIDIYLQRVCHKRYGRGEKKSHQRASVEKRSSETHGEQEKWLRVI